MEQETVTSTRSQRVRKTSTSRLSALEKLKNLKASGHKYKAEIKEVDNIYEEVDEYKYSEIIKSRQDDDWIVDDGTGNYRDDGREIFEMEDDNAEDNYQKGKKRPKLDVVEKNKYGADIKQMFLASSMNKNPSKEAKSINLQEDDILNDIVKELNSSMNTNTSHNKTHGHYNLKKSPYKPLNFSHNSDNDGLYMNGNKSNYKETPKKYLTNPSPASLNLLDDDKQYKQKHMPSSNHNNLIKPEFYPSHNNEDVNLNNQNECEAENLIPNCTDDFSNESWSFQNNTLDAQSKEIYKSENEIKFETYVNKYNNPQMKVECDYQTPLNISKESSPPSNNVDSKGIYENYSFQTHKDSEEKPYFLVYWIDAYEDLYNKPGTIYLFGKAYAPEIKSFVSCGIVVKNIPRTVYLLPKNDQFLKHPLMQKRERFVKSYQQMRLIFNHSSVDILDIYNEFTSKLAEKFKIKKFLSRKVYKRYAFDKFAQTNLEGEEEVAANYSSIQSIPLVSAYLEVRYDASLPPLPAIWPEGSTFNRILGTKTPFLETFLLEKKIMGPCWLKIGLDPAKKNDSSLTWCKLETCLENGTDFISLHEGTIKNFDMYTSPPPLTSLTIAFQTIMAEKSKERELIMVAGIVEKGLSLETGIKINTSKTPNGKYRGEDEKVECFCVITRPSDAILPSDFRRHLNNVPGLGDHYFSKASTKMEVMPSQRALISYLLAKLHKIDPDIIVGYDTGNYDLGLLLKICQSSKIPNWSRIGRLKRSIFPKMNSRGHSRDGSYSSYQDKQIMSGRLLCDILPNCRELIKCTSYKLSEICDVVLGQGQFNKAACSVLPLSSTSLDSECNTLVEPNTTPVSHHIYGDAASLISAVRAAIAQVTLLHRVSDQLKILPLAYQLTRISGNILSRTLTGGRAERNTYLLLHAFHDQQYLSPELYNPYAAASCNNTRFKAKDTTPGNVKSAKGKTSKSRNRHKGKPSSLISVKDESNDALQDVCNIGEESFFDEDFETDAGQDMADFVAETSVNTGNKKKKGPSYIGGLVFEPKVGFYDKFVLLLDFNSLYPSIIQEFNVCFTTIPSDDGQSSLVIDPELKKDLPDEVQNQGSTKQHQHQHLGILPIEIRKLVESRRHIKALMKDPKLSPYQRAQYEIRQKALKLTANSMYGCLGFYASRFYAKPLASLITQKGRDILMNTKELVTKMSLDVIYGDTDSLMVNTYSHDLGQIFKIGNKVKSEVNKLYKYLELDLDGIFKSLLLIKKKKYAALKVNLPCEDYSKVTYEKEVKGLDIVRRDWSALAKNAGSYVLDQILSENSREIIVDNIHSYLNDISEAIRKDKVALSEFYIYKQLNKSPEDYPEKNSLPHVQVALRMSQKTGKRYKAGDIVSYIICQDGKTSKSATQRAYHPEEYKSDIVKGKGECTTDPGEQDNEEEQRLVLDKEYYLSQQILPVVGRLCECIEGTDQAIISQFLGLKSANDTYRSFNGNNGGGYGNRRDDEVSVLFGLDGYCDEERFNNVADLEIPCPGSPKSVRETSEASTSHSQHTIPFHDLFTKNNTDEPDANISRCSLSPCTACGIELSNYVPYFCNTLTLKIKQHIDRYYQNWLKCDDITCAYTTRMVPLKGTNNLKNEIPCPRCNQGNLYLEYDETRLYDQLCYYEHIFDLERAFRNFNSVDQIKLRRNFQPFIPLYKKLKDTVTRYLKNSSYAMIDLGKLFDFYAKLPKQS